MIPIDTSQMYGAIQPVILKLRKLLAFQFDRSQNSQTFQDPKLN